VNEDVKLFFVLTNAIFDAGIMAWDTRRAFDSVRSATAVPYVLQGRQIRAWGGPGRGTITMDGSFWIPYQLSTFPTRPPFPEFVSGHSAFSAAGATILKKFTGSDAFGDSISLAAGSSKIEPGVTPSKPITLRWERLAKRPVRRASRAGMGNSLQEGRPHGQSGRKDCRTPGLEESGSPYGVAANANLTGSNLRTASEAMQTITERHT
jgi:hypothetical protein